MKEISVVIPAYNEEGTLGDVIQDVKEALSSAKILGEIIVVDDNSTDKTAEIALENGAKLIKLSKNRGYGFALKKGIKSARYEYILIVDADGTYPREGISALLEEKGDYDMLIGVRIGLDPSPIKKPVKWLFNKIAGYIAGEKIPDINSGLRIFKKSLVEEFLEILPDGFSFTSTITIASITNNKEVRYKNVAYIKRKKSSHFHPIKDTFSMFSLVLRTIIYFNPLKIFLPLSMFFFIAATLLFIYRVFVQKAFMTTIIILYVSALQVLAIGLLADLIERKTR